MYDMGTRKRALALVAQGRSLNSVSRQMGTSRYAIRSWQTRIEPVERVGKRCPRCQKVPDLPQDPAAYGYLLGLYLGDGCINAHHRGVYFMRVVLDDAWPGIIDACEVAMRAVRPDNSVFRDALGKVGVEWTTLARGSDPFNISIARKASVALLDAHVGPKY